jgi:hypothetical protein
MERCSWCSDRQTLFVTQFSPFARNQFHKITHYISVKFVCTLHATSYNWSWATQCRMTVTVVPFNKSGALLSNTDNLLSTRSVDVSLKLCSLYFHKARKCRCPFYRRMLLWIVVEWENSVSWQNSVSWYMFTVLIGWISFNHLSRELLMNCSSFISQIDFGLSRNLWIWNSYKHSDFFYVTGGF